MNKILLFAAFLFAISSSAQTTLFEDGNNSIKKGNLFISTTFSVNHGESENRDILVQQFDETYNLDWDITLRSGYFIKDAFALGGFFTYSNELRRLNYQDDNGPVKERRLQRSYTLAPFMRNYLPLGKGRFSLFNETSLGFTYGSFVDQTENSADLNRNVGNTLAAEFALQPGISGFINELVAFEVGTKILSVRSEYSSATKNGDEDNKATEFSNDVSFKVDILSLFLGITFYFPVK
jgi:hypothetical protein